MRIAVVYETVPSPNHGTRRILRLANRLASQHDVIFQPLGPDAEGGTGNQMVAQVLSPLEGADGTLPLGLLKSPWLFEPEKCRRLSEAAAKSIGACDLLWICSWWYFGNHLESVKNQLGARAVIADGDLLSLAHVSRVRAFHREAPVRALKEAAVAVKHVLWEKRALSHASCVVVPSAREAAIVDRYVRAPVRVVRNCVADSPGMAVVHDELGSNPSLVFLGDMRYETNRDAAKRLIGDIWPATVSRFPQAAAGWRLIIAGWEASTLATEIEAVRDDIVIMSDIESVPALLSRCRVAAIPNRHGGGSPHKILEAAAAGMPVVCSPYVASTLDECPPRGLHICRSSDEYARSIGPLLSDALLAQSEGKVMHEWASRVYPIEVWIKDVNEVGRAVGVGSLLGRLGQSQDTP